MSAGESRVSVCSSLSMRLTMPVSTLLPPASTVAVTPSAREARHAFAPAHPRRHLFGQKLPNHFGLGHFGGRDIGDQRDRRAA